MGTAFTGTRARVALAALCLVVAGWMVVHWTSERDVTKAQSALDAGQPQRALDLTRSLDGSSVVDRAARIAALAELRLGQLPAAEQQLRREIAASPKDWHARFDHAVILLRLGRTSDAQLEMSRARALNPRLTLPPGFIRPGG